MKDTVIIELTKEQCDNILEEVLDLAWLNKPLACKIQGRGSSDSTQDKVELILYVPKIKYV